MQEKNPQFVAMVEGNVIGWCDIGSLRRPVFAHCGVLGMGIIKEFRGKGIGKALIDTALETAKSKGLARVELTVFESNQPAINFYKKVGFEIEGINVKARSSNQYMKT